MAKDQVVAVGDEPAHFRQMIDSIVDYEVIRLDEKGVISSWHPGAQLLTQYTAEEAIGKPVTLFYTEEDIVEGKADAELRAAAETGRYGTEGWRVRKDGSQFWASVVLTPIREPGGTVTGFVKVTADLTEQREQTLALRAGQQMLDGIADYEVIRLDSDGVVRSWNPGAVKLTGYVADEVVGRHVSMFYTEEDKRGAMAEREMASAARDGSLEVEGWRIRKDGTRFWANVVLSPILDDQGEVTGFVKVARDLTERREQEQLVQRQRDEILELSTPVIQVWDKVLILPLIGTLDSVRAARLTESLLERIAADQAEVVILDVSGVPAIDSGVARHLLKTVEAARLMGTASILSGIRPEIAQSMVHLGIELGGLRSCTSLKDALQLALRLVRAGADAADLAGRHA
ncbi:PAS domain S-box protein [Actinoplanes subtropicus]|uniref:PAS domain S-box protein n=1 Tax=Actinoplanes subtropicus TaxID=543632 RepID=UPI00068E1653|nr:PAS domain S-box protein [Actinoplanes subtropicus]